MSQPGKIEPAASTPVTIGDPGPLGLAGFALTTFVLSSLNAELFVPNPSQNRAIFIGVAFFYGGLAQLLAGMWEFRTGNTFGATAFSSYGAFWMALAAVSIPAFNIKAGLTDPDPAVGLFLLAWTIFTALMTLGACRINGALAALFIVLLITFIALTYGHLVQPKPWNKIGGYLGLATASVAWYVMLAGILRSASGGAIQLPVFPFKK
ncbi:MAG: acetate uptake transporter [Isosphaeraceae bacterium]